MGLVFGSLGAGGVIGALLMGSLRADIRSSRLAYVGWGVSAVGAACVAFAPNAAIAAALLSVASFGGQIGEVTWATLLQRFVPRHLLGRVTSTDWLVSLSLQPLGLAVAAPVAAAIGVSGALLAGGALAMLAVGAGMAVPSVRHMRGAPE